MSVVLLEQLLEDYNLDEEVYKLEVYNCILPTGIIEIGILDTHANTSVIRVNAIQSPELSHLECINQGASMIIQSIFKSGLETILPENGKL